MQHSVSKKMNGHHIIFLYVSEEENYSNYYENLSSVALKLMFTNGL